MPLYEFSCVDCAVRTDVRASVRELEEGLSVRCSSCGSRNVRRLLSAAAVVRSGSAPAGAARGGGCCAAGCACGAN